MSDLPVSRRSFVAGAGALGAATVFAPQALAQGLSGRRAPTLRGGRFPEGVLSGDPTPRAITLWTRVAGVGGRGSVELEVAKDRGFDRVVARDLVGTSGAGDHYVKARVGGLDPHEEYFYRFSTRTRSSPVGRFRTALPPDSRQPVTFAFFSCQDFTFGYYNAHALLAREDVDFVINLGDYIYAEAYHTAGSKSGGVRTDRIGLARSLQDYRDKYRLYRSDSNLRRMHAEFPMISIWDDHEVQDNYAGGAPGGGLPGDAGYTERRRAAGYRAYFESMPTYGFGPRRRNRIYGASRFGRNLDLVLLDQRQYRADQPCNDELVADPCAKLDRPRNFLGRRQMGFVKKRLQSSPAAWKVLANQTMVERTVYPGGRYIGFDSWQGYPRERRELLSHLKREQIEDVVFVTGDIHTFIAGDVRIDDNDRRPVATEFVGGSITSQGLGEGGGMLVPGADPRNPKTPEGIKDLLREANPWVRDADFDHHGYGLAVAGPKDFRCTFKRVAGTKQRSAKKLPDKPFAFRIERGRPSLL
ncbi:MAG: alkaline phosphatase D family protein [Actinomycetota bacterium]|nr:alkaline phosphatase D family protein [Actinomycetota bacterium]